MDRPPKRSHSRVPLKGLAKRFLFAVVDTGRRRQEPQPSLSPGHRMVGGQRLDHLLAGAAGKRFAGVAHDLEPVWHVVDALGDVLADSP